MANKKFEDYVIAGDNITLTYDNNADTVTIDAAGNVDSVNGQVGVVVLTKTDIGLGNVDNTSDANKTISSATQTALNGKQDTLVSGTNIKTVNSNSLLGSGDVVIDKSSVGLGNVANVDTTNASNITSGTLSDSRLSSNVTTQGNTFNAANKLVQLDGTAKLPAVDGSQLTNLAWGNISGKPTTLGGYGITDAVNTGGSYADPSWITSLAFSKITGYSTPTLAQVTTAGNTTTNAISVGGLTVATSLIYTDTVNGRVGIGTTSPGFNLDIYGGTLNNPYIRLRTNAAASGSNYANGIIFDRTSGGATNNIGIYTDPSRGHTTNADALTFALINSPYTRLFTIQQNAGLVLGSYAGSNIAPANGMIISGNVGIGTPTDAGYKLDVNGTARVQNTLLLGRLTADPATNLVNGQLYYNTTTNKFRGYENGTWVNLI